MGDRHPLTASERLRARVLTGPVGHLYAGLVDWLVLVARIGATALSARARRAATRRGRP